MEFHSGERRTPPRPQVFGKQSELKLEPGRLSWCIFAIFPARSCQEDPDSKPRSPKIAQLLAIIVQDSLPRASNETSQDPKMCPELHSDVHFYTSAIFANIASKFPKFPRSPASGWPCNLYLRPYCQHPALILALTSVFW